MRILRKLDDKGTLLIEQKGGDLKEPSSLSTGTREQLYLAIRLAFVMHYCRDSEPLPLVMDDVLVNFDDRRARQTLDVLIERSREVQILFLTCHRHVTELVHEALPGIEPILLSQGDTPIEVKQPLKPDDVGAAADAPRPKRAARREGGRMKAEG